MRRPSPCLLTTVCCLLGLLPLYTSCAPKPVRRPTPERVGVAPGRPVTVQVTLGVESRRFEISVPGGGSVEERRGEKGSAPFAFRGEYRVDPASIPAAGVFLWPPLGKSLEYDLRRYPGNIELRPMDDGSVQVINNVDLEEYTACVMMGEVSPKWHAEALRAQAVATRSFALCHHLRGGGTPLLTAKVTSQVYPGRVEGMEPMRQAASQTEGQVLWYRGEVITAFFHANCGGCTADSEMVWSRELSYLRSRWCRYCQGRKHYRWQLALRRQELERICAERGLPGVYGLKVNRVDRSGRASSVRLLSPLGERVVRGGDLRAIIGYDRLRSAKFEVSGDAKNIYFEGLGWGHGVGLCQEGALGMAEEGGNYKAILRYYFKDCSIKKWVQ